MYLFIFEDGSMRVGNSISDGDRSAVDDGILDIVRARFDGADTIYEQFYEGDWHSINAV